MRVPVQYLLQASTVSTAYVHQRHLATLCGSQLAKVEMSDEREIAISSPESPTWKVYAFRILRYDSPDWRTIGCEVDCRVRWREVIGCGPRGTSETSTCGGTNSAYLLSFNLSSSSPSPDGISSFARSSNDSIPNRTLSAIAIARR